MALIPNPVITITNVQTSAATDGTTGTNYVTFPSASASSIDITNTTGVTIEVQRNGAGVGFSIASGSRKTFNNITNANQIGVRRADFVATTVTVQAELGIIVSTADIPAQSNAIQVHSLDRLFANYTGPCIQVRRTSDGALQDIGFDSNGNLDVKALLRFCGVAGTVRIWYDQSGLGNHVIQTTTANQPTIVANGNVLQTIDGRPALFFDGVNDSLGNSGSSFPTGSGAFTANIRLKFFDRLSSPTRTYLKWGAESTNTGIIITRDTNSDLWVRTGNGQYVANSERNEFAKSQTLINDGTTFRGYYDGFSTTWLNLPPTYNIAAGNFTIGNNAIVFASPFYGYINEVVIYNKALTESERIALETNQNIRNDVAPLYNLVFDGDSITLAQLGTTSYFAGWRWLYMDYLRSRGISLRQVSVCANGASATTRNTAALDTTGIDNMQFYTAGKTILFAMLGKNDIGNEGQSAAQAYADYVTYVTNRKATGKYDRIVVFTTSPSVSDAGSVVMTAFSNLVRAGMQPGGSLRAAGATDLIDLQLAVDGTGYAPYADPSGWNNPTYIHAPDKIHPTDAGHVLIFNLVRSTLNI